MEYFDKLLEAILNEQPTAPAKEPKTKPDIPLPTRTPKKSPIVPTPGKKPKPKAKNRDVALFLKTRESRA